MRWSLPRFVRVRESGPRDGFQNEQSFIPTETKIELIDSLQTTGLSRVEVTSFVHPKWIPQLADADEVVRGIGKPPGVAHAVLVPNQRGVERAIAAREAGAKIDDVSFVMSASEGHNRSNLNKPVKQSLQELGELIPRARHSGFRVVCGLSVAFGCPIDGRVDQGRVMEIAEEMQRLGADEIYLADTAGMANPRAVHALFARAKRELRQVELTAHFHNSRGQGLANVLAAMLEGVDSFESSFGELGGCPYSPGATGNIATEDLVAMLHEMGVETGVDLDRLLECARQAQRALGRELPGHLLKAGPINWLAPSPSRLGSGQA